MKHLGVALCTCGNEIEKHIDVDCVARSLQGAAAVSVMPRLCQKQDRRALLDWIGINQLDGLIVAACPSRFVGHLFAQVGVQAGLTALQTALVDWREGCAWAHSRDRDGATERAVSQLRMAMAQLESAHLVQSRGGPIVARVLIVGGGITGMTAARELAGRNISVTLVERSSELGGSLHRVPLNGQGEPFQDLVDFVSDHPLVDLRLNTRVEQVQGTTGSYRVTISNRIAPPEELVVGAAVIATGTVEMRPPVTFAHDGRRIVTLAEHAQELGRGIAAGSSLVYLLCAGSRDTSIPYCSQVCCAGSLDQALRVKQAHPETHITIVCRELYLSDQKAEDKVQQAFRAGIEFQCYQPQRPVHVGEDSLQFHKAASGEHREIQFDRLVLATPLGPDAEAGHLGLVFGLDRDAHGFFVDPHMRLRPERVSDRGIFVAGSAHGPVDQDTAILQGMVAGARAARWIEKGIVRSSEWAAFSKPELCTGCAQCVEACPFGAIHLTRSPGAEGARASIDPLRCLACGNCLAACPSKAIDMPVVSDRQVLAQIDAAASDGPNPLPSLIFACQWSGFAAMELAGARRLEYPAGVRILELPCSTRLDPLHVLYALLSGFERVTLALCPPGECHFGNQNRVALERIESLRKQMQAWGMDPGRIRVAPLKGDDAAAWVRTAVEAVAESRQ